MIQRMQHRVFYHGWLIELVALSQGHAFQGYTFHCWLPSETVGLSDRALYPSATVALAAAQSRADLESVKLAVEHCHSTFQQGNLNGFEYWTLTDLITQTISSQQS